MSYLIPQVSFSLNIASLLNVMRNNSSVLFLAGTLYDFEKNCNCLGETSPNLYFDSLLLLKIHNISAKKEQGSYVS